MNIIGYKVLTTLTYHDNKTEHDVTVYIFRREPAYCYAEFGTDDEKMGFLFNKEHDLIAVSWIQDIKFDEKTINKKIKQVLPANIDFDSYHFNTAKSDLVLLSYYQYYADFTDNYLDSYYKLPSFFIVWINEKWIKFSNGKSMTFDHIQDCCEHNYADFLGIDDISLDYKLHEPLTYEVVENYGFRFGNRDSMVSVPCYSEQNGYYSTDVDIYYDGTCVLETSGELLEY